MPELSIDINNTKNLTIIVIGCVLLFACVYLMMIRKDSQDGFIDYPLEAGDNVLLKAGSLNQIKVGPNSFSPSATVIIDDMIERKIVEKQIINKITNLENSNQLPAYSIVAYNGSVAPQGWQFCDGSPLLYTNGSNVEGPSTATGRPFINTPDIRGRVIVGVNSAQFNDTTDKNNPISKRDLNTKGGFENVALNITEMPSHTHKISRNPNNSHWTGWSMPNWALLGSANNTPDFDLTNAGGDPADNNKTKPHENMQPFLVLNYIIKQPIKT